MSESRLQVQQSERATHLKSVMPAIRFLPFAIASPHLLRPAPSASSRLRRLCLPHHESGEAHEDGQCRAHWRKGQCPQVWSPLVPSFLSRVLVLWKGSRASSCVRLISFVCWCGEVIFRRDCFHTFSDCRYLGLGF